MKFSNKIPHAASCYCRSCLPRHIMNSALDADFYLKDPVAREGRAAIVVEPLTKAV